MLLAPSVSWVRGAGSGTAERDILHCLTNPTVGGACTNRLALEGYETGLLGGIEPSVPDCVQWWECFLEKETRLATGGATHNP